MSELMRIRQRYMALGFVNRFLILLTALFLWRVVANMLHNQRMLDMLSAYGQSVNESNPARLMSEGGAA